MRRISKALAILLFGVSAVTAIQRSPPGGFASTTKGALNQRQANSLASVKSELQAKGKGKNGLKGRGFQE
jgi:hypothetical protein